jgi:hypothetical protein
MRWLCFSVPVASVYRIGKKSKTEEPEGDHAYFILSSETYDPVEPTDDGTKNPWETVAA